MRKHRTKPTDLSLGVWLGVGVFGCAFAIALQQFNRASMCQYPALVIGICGLAWFSYLLSKGT